MKFPSTGEFLEAFGIEPIEEDPSMAYCRYVKNQSMATKKWISPSARFLNLSK
jgi:hypothetical protein